MDIPAVTREYTPGACCNSRKPMRLSPPCEMRPDSPPFFHIRAYSQVWRVRTCMCLLGATIHPTTYRVGPGPGWRWETRRRGLHCFRWVMRGLGHAGEIIRLPLVFNGESNWLYPALRTSWGPHPIWASGCWGHCDVL